MKLVIRLGRVPGSDSWPQKHRKLALATAALLAPAALAAYALGAWRIAADMRWSSEFAISGGIFSHWQVWIALGAAIQATAVLLTRYGSRAATFPSRKTLIVDTPESTPGSRR